MSSHKKYDFFIFIVLWATLPSRGEETRIKVILTINFMIICAVFLEVLIRDIRIFIRANSPIIFRQVTILRYHMAYVQAMPYQKLSANLILKQPLIRPSTSACQKST